MQLAVSNSHGLQSAQSASIQELLSKKALYQQIVSKNESLPCIIAEKQQILNSLTLANAKLESEVMLRSKELCDLQTALEQFQRIETEVFKLEERERQLESQYEDYRQLNGKLDKEVKLLQEQCQIVKGKTIIDYNKLNQLREQVSQQLKQKEVLQKHRQQLKKGSQVLKKRIHTLKEQHKKKSYCKHRIEEADLQKQLKELRLQIEYKQSQLEQKEKSKDQYLTQEQYEQMLSEIKALKEHNQSFEDQARLNRKLKDDKLALEQRIRFLQSVDIEFINQKRMLLRELKQKHILIEASMRTDLAHLTKKQQQLREIQLQYPEGLTLLKRNSRKKREPKLKTTKKTKEIVQKVAQEQVREIKASSYSSFRGHKFKRILIYIFVTSIALGLIFDRLVYENN